MTKTYAILVAVAAVVLGVYFMHPARYFVDAVFQPHESIKVVAYDDEVDGGSSKTKFDVNDSSLAFSCTLGGTEEQSAWCGLLFDLRRVEDNLFRDWSFVDSLIFDVEASGTDEILVKVWTYDPAVTDTTKPRTYRLLMKELPLTGGHQRIAVPMEQFYTPEFWYKDEHVDTSLIDRHQETVARFEIAPGWKHPRGKEFSLKFYGIFAKGLSNFAFGVVMIAMLILMIVAIGRTHSYHKDKLESDK